MEIVEKTPDRFLSELGDETMVELDRVIRAALPDRCRVLWEGVFWGGTEQSIVGYGHITQSRSKGDDVEWFLVGLARQKNNYSIYVNAVADGAYLAHGYGDRLGKVKLGAASIGFRRLENLNLEMLGEMLARADELTAPDS